MLLKQCDPGCFAPTSYLTVDAATGTAVAVDPQRNVNQYPQDATQHDFHSRDVSCTHFRADFFACHLKRRERAGTPICPGAQAQVEHPVMPCKGGEALDTEHLRAVRTGDIGHSALTVSIGFSASEPARLGGRIAVCKAAGLDMVATAAV